MSDYADMRAELIAERDKAREQWSRICYDSLLDAYWHLVRMGAKPPVPYARRPITEWEQAVAERAAHLAELRACLKLHHDRQSWLVRFMVWVRRGFRRLPT